VSDTRNFAHPWQTIAVALAALAVECAALRDCLLPRPEWAGAAAIHLGTVVALLLWYRFSPGIATDVRIPLILISATAALGPFGPAAALFTMALSRWLMRHATPFEEWYRTLFPEFADDAGADLARRAASAMVDSPTSLAPFAEVLAFGSLHQKQALIALMNQSFRPAFGPILKRALTDENNGVRVQAATVMNRIENMMHAQTIELTARLEREPGDPEALLALARHYDGHLYSRILDTRREEEIRERALETWHRYLALKPDDIDSRIAAGRLQLRSGLFEDAACSLRKVIDAGAAPPQADLWYMESLYRLGRYPELRAYAHAPENNPDEDTTFSPAAREAVLLWAGEDSVAL
jgi:tetratricopeptide (TPR) repeat protein